MTQRDDIDGLRALAILSVVLAHAGFPVAAGGYVGVDVFFVISGFLITGLVRDALEAGRFSLREFYVRRARRILPALIATVGATVLVGSVLLLPQDWKQLQQSALAALGFVPNVYFWKMAGYFEPAGETLPLLHTWSLGVEEQFYLLMPALLIVCARFSRGGLAMLLFALALLSLAAGVWAVTAHTRSAFYLLPFRAWELLLGAGLVGMPLTRAPRILREVAAAAGLGLIGWAVTAFDASTEFPGYAALAPVGGAALIVAAGTGGASRVSRGLAWSPLVFVGRISYSFYLWHWPVLVFARYWNLGELTPGWSCAAVLASLLLAGLSWRFIEQPWRRPRPGAQPVRGAALAAAVALVAAAAGSQLLAQQRIGRYPADVNALLAYDAPPFREQMKRAYGAGSCFVLPDFPRYDRAVCLQRRPDRPNVLLLGDSAAAHLMPGLRAALPEWNLLQLTATACRGLRTQAVHAPGGARCEALMRSAFDEFLAIERVDAVILASDWSSADLRALPETLSRLKASSAQVVLVGPPVAYDLALPVLLARAALRGAAADEVAAAHLDAAAFSLDNQLRVLAAAAAVRYWSPTTALCHDGRCALYAAPGVPWQWDRHHLTVEGSQALVRRWQSTDPLR